MNTPSDSTDQRAIDEKLRRQTGIAALRKLRGMVDAENLQRESDRQFVKRALISFGLVLFAVVVAVLWFRGVL